MDQNVLARTLLTLTDSGVEFVVCGGVACILHGVARATHDLDLRVALDQSNLERLVQSAQSLGLTPRVPEPMEALLSAERRRVWIHEKHALVYTLLTPNGTFAMDIFLDYPLGYPELRAAAQPFSVHGRVVWVSSKEHLIQAKRAVQPPRRKDVRDIEDLLALLDE